VIIDEIDKAPRDFPNDLLNEIDRMAFRVPELRYAATPGMDDPKRGIAPDLRPIIVITSNSEKGLPEPFLRRCVYHNITFPKDPKAREEKLGAIVAARLSGLTGTCRLVSDALSLFNELRSPSEGNLLRVPPATAQLLDFLQILTALGYTESSSIRAPAALPNLARAIGTLVKGPEDEMLATRVLEAWCSSPSPSLSRS
jgi:MoxR-like ATPase